MSIRDPTNISGWHLRGAIAGALYGFADPHPLMAAFYAAPIDTASAGLKDYRKFKPKPLSGLTAVMNNLPDDLMDFISVRETVRSVLDHLNFVQIYKRAGGKFEPVIDSTVLESGQTFARRFKSALDSMKVHHVSDLFLPDPITSSAVPIAPSAFQKALQASLQRRSSETNQYFPVPGIFNFQSDPLLPFTVGTQQHGEMISRLKSASSIAGYSDPFRPYTQAPRVVVNLFTEETETMLWPQSRLLKFCRPPEKPAKRNPPPDRMEISEREDIESSCHSSMSQSPVESGSDQFVSDQPVKASPIQIEMKPSPPKRVKHSFQNSDSIIDEFNMVVSSSPTDNDERKDLADSISALFITDRSGKIKNVLNLFIDLEGMGVEELKTFLMNFSLEELDSMMKDCNLAMTTSSHDDCSDEDDDEQKKSKSKLEFKGEKKETIDMIIEVLENPCVRSRLHEIDRNLAEIIRTDGYSAKTVRICLNNFSLDDVKGILNKALDNSLVSPIDTDANNRSSAPLMSELRASPGPSSSSFFSDVEVVDKNALIQNILKLAENPRNLCQIAKIVKSMEVYMFNFRKQIICFSEWGKDFLKTLPPCEINILHSELSKYQSELDAQANGNLLRSINMVDEVFDGFVTGDDLKALIRPHLRLQEADSDSLDSVCNRIAIPENSSRSVANLVESIKGKDLWLKMWTDADWIARRPMMFDVSTIENMNRLCYRMLPDEVLPSQTQELFKLIKYSIPCYGDRIERIDFVQVNSSIVTDFYTKWKELDVKGFGEEKIVFHGTDESNIRSIFSENFQLDAQPCNRKKLNAHGTGIYFSSSIHKAASYSNSDNIIVARVLPGKIDTSRQTYERVTHTLPRPRSFDTTNEFNSKEVGEILVIKTSEQILPVGVVKMPKVYERSSVHTLPNLWMQMTQSRHFANQVPCGTKYITAHGQVSNYRYSEQPCPVCKKSKISKKGLNQYESYERPERLKMKLNGCDHLLHLSCFRELQKRPLTTAQNFTCPICRKTTSAAVTGSQPENGTLTVNTMTTSSDVKVIVVEFNFQDGVQTVIHPQPGAPYEARGFPRKAFLPNTEEGREILELLKRAFDRGHLFYVGRFNYAADASSFVVEWGPVQLKTSVEDLQDNNPDYLANVRNELKNIGIS